MKKNIQLQKSYKILLIGDSCDDVYVHGQIDGYCFESRPISKGTPVLKASEVVTKPGMAKNVYKNLVALNQNVDFYTNTENVQKVRVVDENNKSIVRIDYNDNISSCDIKSFNNINLKKYDCIAISDYNKGYVSDETITYLTKNFDGKIFVDSKKIDLSFYEKCTIKINEHEHALVQIFPKNYELIVTLGNRGASWKNKIFEPYQCSKIIDICGAGDTFFAALIVGYLQTKDYDISIRIANQCAASVLQYIGNHCISSEQFQKILNSNL